MGELTGTLALVRMIVRRDRVRIVVWIAAIFALVFVTALSVKGLYPTQADLDAAAAAAHDNAAALAFNGPDQGLNTLGGQIAFQVGAFGLVMVALMSMFMVGRETRAEEEAGRTDLVLAMPVGRHAPTAATLLVVGAMNLVLGGLVTLSMLSQGLPTAGSVSFGVSFCALGLAFAAVTIAAAQVTENTRVVYGVTGAAVGAAFVLRAAGDVGAGTLSWLSPIGWAQKLRPFAGERWWPLLVIGAFTVGLAVVAALLAARRDVGSGLVQPRRGRPSAAPGLGRPLGLAVRLQRGSVIAWAVGLFLIGIAYGSVANDVEDFIGDNENVREILARSGIANLTDSYLGTSLLLLALVGTGFAVAAVLRLRSEETALRAEPILATPISRPRWAAGHVAVALGGSVIVLGLAGLGTGLAFAVAAGEPGQVLRLTGAALAYLPAVWVLVGVAFALYGLAPRAALAAWAAVALCFVIGFLGDVLNLPSWFRTVSPFEHIPLVPAEHLAALPVLAVGAIAAGLLAAGFASLQRRDIG